MIAREGMITREVIIKAMEDAMIDIGHNAPWSLRALVAFNAINEEGAAVVDRDELKRLKESYGFSLPDLAEPQE